MTDADRAGASDGISDETRAQLRTAFATLSAGGRSLQEIWLLLRRATASSADLSADASFSARREMINTYVAALNGSDRCRLSHAQMLRSQGPQHSLAAQALLNGELD